MHDILPRHLRQSTDLAGRRKVMDALFHDLAANAVAKAKAVVNALPPDFPESL